MPQTTTSKIGPELQKAIDSGTTGTIYVNIILKDQPLHEVSASVKEKHKKEVDVSKSRIKTITEEARKRTKRDKKIKALSKEDEKKIDIYRSLTDAEKVEIEKENLRLKNIKRQTVKEIIDSTKTIIRPQQAKVRTAIKDAGGKTTYEGLFFNIISADVPVASLYEIASLPEVGLIEKSQIYHPLLDTATYSVYAPTFWTAGYNGSPFAVAVVDTGVDGGHPNLNASYLDGKDINTTDCDNSPDDVFGHGTHVAGIIASNHSTYKGIAPGAGIINAKVFSSTDCVSWVGYDSDIMAGIDWAIYNASGGADIISASFGSSVRDLSFERFFDALVDDLGIFAVVAAGNDGPSSGTINSPGATYNVMTVGAVDDNDTATRSDDSIAGYSSRGPVTADIVKPDIIAPGSSITSASNTWEGANPDFIGASGTSMATPIVSGAAALLMSAGVTDALEIKALLLNTAEDIAPVGPDNASGWGYLDLNHTFYHTNDVRRETAVNVTRLKLYYVGPALSGDKATIAWNRYSAYNGPDYPTSYNSNVSDLDLYLYSETSGAELDNSTMWYSNVEQVISPANDTVVIKVDAFSLQRSSETFALATEEGFTQTSLPEITANITQLNTAYANSTFQIEVNATNNGSIAIHNVNITLNLPAGVSIVNGTSPVQLGSISGGSSKTNTFTLIAATPGNKTINATVNSSSYGEVISTFSSISIEVLDITPPSITFVTPTLANGSTVNVSSAYINVTLSEPADSVLLEWNGTNETMLEGSWHLNKTNLTDGTYTYRVWANDTVGNLNVSETRTLIVDLPKPVHNLNKGTNYTTIQAAIDDANENDTITVNAGTYNENIDINKSINLVGAGADETIINASNSSDHVVEITANWVNVSGFKLTGATGLFKAGVYLRNSDYSKIFNLNVTYNDWGVYLASSNNNTLIENAISNIDGYGINLYNSDYSIITNNSLSHNFRGIYLKGSNNYNTISNNTFNSNGYGISLIDNYGNHIYYNNFINNTNPSSDNGNNTWDNGYPSGGNYWSDFDSAAEGCSDSNNDNICDSPYNISGGNNTDRYPVTTPDGWLNITPTIFNNDTGKAYPTIQAAIDDSNANDTITVDAGTYNENIDINKTINLVGNGADVTIINASNSSDHVIEITADWVNVSGFSVTGSSAGYLDGSIHLTNVTNAKIMDNNILSNGGSEGIMLWNTNNSKILNNTLDSNWGSGITLHYSNDIHIENNNVTKNTVGIVLGGSSNNTIKNNFVSNNPPGGIYLGGAPALGFHPEPVWINSSNNTLSGNIINSNNQYGITLAEYVYYNIIVGNNITNQNQGIFLDYNWPIHVAYGNTIYHNNFINNTNQSYDDGNNTWDNGYPSGGNYWSDFDSAAEGCNDSNNDNICDSPYNISGGNNTDRYPVTSENGWENNQVLPVTNGTNQTNSFPDLGLNLTFENVTSSGVTTVIKSSGNPGGGLPTNYKVAGFYFNISTTANYIGNITICLSGFDVQPDYKLHHWTNGSWTDITTLVDDTADYICGSTTSLSPFAALYYQAPPPPPSGGGGGGGGGTGSGGVVSTIFEGRGVLTEDDLLDIMVFLGHDFGPKFAFGRFMSPLTSIYAAKDKVVMSLDLASRLVEKINLAALGLEKREEGDIYEENANYILQHYPGGDTLIISRGDLGYDSLTASPLSDITGAPTLLVEPGAIPDPALKVLKRRQYRKMYIIGGEEAISSEVEEELKAHAKEVVRLGGETRYETSVEVAKEVIAQGGNRLPITTSGKDPVLYTATLANKYRSPIIYIDRPPVQKSTFKSHDTVEGSIAVESFATFQAIGDKSPPYVMTLPVRTQKIKDAWMYLHTIGYDSVAEKWHVKLNDYTLAYLVHSKPAATYENSQLIRFDVGNYLKEGLNDLYIAGKEFNVNDQYYITGVTLVILYDSGEKTEFWINEDHKRSFEEGDFGRVDDAWLIALYLEDDSEMELQFNGRPIDLRVMHPTMLREATIFSTLGEADVEGIVERSNSISGDPPALSILTVSSDEIEVVSEELEEVADPHQAFVQDYLEAEKFEQLGMVYYKKSLSNN